MRRPIYPDPNSRRVIGTSDSRAPTSVWGHPLRFPWSLALVALTAVGTLAACGAAGASDREGAGAQPARPPAGGIPVRGTLTLEDYAPSAINPRALGVVDLALPAGTKTRVLEGANPWRHPNGTVVFTQGCGDRVNRVALAREGLITPVSPCSSTIRNPDQGFGYFPPHFEFSRLSPDGRRVAVELVRTTGQGGYAFAVLVYDLAGRLVTSFPDALGPAWLPDGRLAMAGVGPTGAGILVTDRALGRPTRLDRGQLNGPVNNLDVDPPGERIAFEYNQQIWVCDVTTGAVRGLVSGHTRLRYPTFSPDGQTVASLGVGYADRNEPTIYFNNIFKPGAYALPYPTPQAALEAPNGPLSWTR